MPLYRSDQSQLSVHAEAGHGGYLDYVSSFSAGAKADTTLSAAAVAGARSISVGAIGTYAVDDYLAIGTVANGNREIRRIVAISGTTVTVDYPLGFDHESGETVEDVDATQTVSGSSFATFLPGVYEAVTVPDPVYEFQPKYFLGTSANRNFTVNYRGRIALTGSLPNFVLLNGFPLRFPIGRVRTTITSTVADATTTSAAIQVGERRLPIAADADNANYVNSSIIEIERGGTNPEVRQIISGTTGGAGAQTWILNYPVMIAHASGVAVNRSTAASPTYSHTVVENFDLDSLTWHLLMRDSGETTANDFIRRFVGGVVGRATISADENGMLMMSWDDVAFLDFVHNQISHSAASMTRESAALISPAGVGGAIPHSGGVLGTPAFPTTEPYYFSQGDISLFGVTFARIRNFALDINNSVTPYYYIRNLNRERTPAEILEHRREYRMRATIALPDSIASSATTRTLFKELLLEGNYTAGFTGFDISLIFTRGTNDTITFTIPSSAAATGLNAQGAFIARAPHNVNPGDPLVQADVDIIFRNMQIVIADSVSVYP